MYACAKWQHLIYVFIRWIVVKSLTFRGKSTNFWIKCMEKNEKICNWCKIFHPCPSPPLHPKSYHQPQGVGVIIITCYSEKLLRIHFCFMRIRIKMDTDPGQIFGLGANVFFYILHLGFGSGDLHMFTDPDELTKYIFV